MLLVLVVKTLKVQITLSVKCVPYGNIFHVQENLVSLHKNYTLCYFSHGVSFMGNILSLLSSLLSYCRVSSSEKMCELETKVALSEVPLLYN